MVLVIKISCWPPVIWSRFMPKEIAHWALAEALVKELQKQKDSLFY